MKRRKNKRGFTLIELMVVVSILVILVAITVISIMGVQNKAKIAKSTAVLLKLMSAIEEYNGAMGDLPPDGYDEESVSQGSASLVQYLCKTLYRNEVRGEGPTADTFQIEVGPYLNEANTTDLTLRYKGDLQKALDDKKNEFRDGWGRPIEYDRVDQDNDGKTIHSDTSHGLADAGHVVKHSITVQYHSQDPRNADPTVWDMRKDYFLWSSGQKTESKSNWTPKSPIGNWNISK